MDKNSEAINMCLGEVYCVKCGKKEYFNSNDPWNTPNKCKHCDGRMTTHQEEKFAIDFEEAYNNFIEFQCSDTRKKLGSKKDQFVINLLESLKEQFADENRYSGSAVKLIINGFIKEWSKKYEYTNTNEHR